jgi:hypothetical protein
LEFMLIQMSNITRTTACIALLLGVSVMAQDGGQCPYDRFAGTARVDSIVPLSSQAGSNTFKVYFNFYSLSLLASSAHQFDMHRDYVMSRGVWISYIKPGHEYPCSLDLIDSGTCTPALFYFGNPSTWEGYDTSQTWSFPDTVEAEKPVILHLVDYSFYCNFILSNLSVTVSDSGIWLSYWAEADQSIRCINNTEFTVVPGISFTLPALKPGSYPIYSDRLPACYPCRMANTVTLIDTLVVASASSIQAPHPISFESSDIRATAWPHGLVRIEWNPASAGMYSIRLLDIAGRIIWEGEKVIAKAGRMITEISLDKTQKTAGLFMLEISLKEKAYLSSQQVKVSIR